MRTFPYRHFQLDELLQAKGQHRVSLCLPAHDEQSTVGAIVERARLELVERVQLVDEVLVVDDASTDATRVVAEAAGARVVDAVGALAPHPAGGKGAALWKATAAATGDLLAFCDADVFDFDPDFVVGLLGPLLHHSEVALVKALYERPIDGRPEGGGRVTELVARPLLSLLFPHLADVAQPLAGEFAARRTLLEELPFVQGYGVDLGLLIDAAELVGVDKLAQVDLGVRRHRNRPLAELAPIASAVLETGLRRAGLEVSDHPPAAQRLPEDLPPLAQLGGYRTVVSPCRYPLGLTAFG